MCLLHDVQRLFYRQACYFEQGLHDIFSFIDVIVVEEDSVARGFLLAGLSSGFKNNKAGGEVRFFDVELHEETSGFPRGYFCKVGRNFLLTFS